MINPASPDYSDLPGSARRPTFTYLPEDLASIPIVSIVTPFHNTGDLFHETAWSVLRQSFQEWEWIIVNDGSTSVEALAILQDYRHFDPRIRVIDHAENRGLSAARNTGFRAARGEYIVQLDSDDLLEPTAVEKWLWFLVSQPEYGFVKGYTVGFGAQEYLWQRGFHDGSAFRDENLVAPTSMIRRSVIDAVGGYDESNRAGLEDWDFWLRCANFGHWGGTVPEYLDWYRRRSSHTDRWTNWDGGKAQRAFHEGLRHRYSRLWEVGFPHLEPRWHMPNESIPDDIPCRNHLRKVKPRLLMLVPWFNMGGAEKFNLDLVRQLTQRGWEITIASTFNGDNYWLPEFSQHTPDIFLLHHFVRLPDYPRVIRYLAQSRQVDAVLITHSQLAYSLLPYLRAHLPDAAFLDYCHIEEEQWKNGGYPQMSVEWRDLLDLTTVSSRHLQDWMVGRGGNSDQIRVCYINVDSDDWRPNSEARESVRSELSVDSDVPVVLYAARICAQKQPKVLAKTARELVHQGVDFTVLVAGDGPEMDWLRSFVAKNRLEKYVRLLGPVPSQRVRQLMAAADLFFLPSQWEGISLAIYEAMACGLPIIGADVGGQRELLTPECGVLIQRADEDTESRRYAEELRKLIENQRRRQDMGEAGRARVAAEFSLDQMGHQMVTLLNEAIHRHATNARERPRLGLAQACAVQAVEYVRLSQLADRLWAERNSIGPVHSVDGPADWRARFFLQLYRWHEPFYHWYSKRGWSWMTPVREKLKQTLLRAT